MCCRKRRGSSAARDFHASICTGPELRESQSPMSQHASLTAVRRPDACCFCWCCCCSCSWNEDRDRLRRPSRDTRLESIPNCEICANPSADEVYGWSGSFEKLMKNPAGRNVFREFLRTEYSEENMLFWLACEELKMECNKEGISEKARLIYEDYVSILSPKEIVAAEHVPFILRILTAKEVERSSCTSVGSHLGPRNYPPVTVRLDARGPITRVRWR